MTHCRADARETIDAAHARDVRAVDYPLYGVIGVAAGALIVYQPVAVLLPLAWALHLENFTAEPRAGGGVPVVAERCDRRARPLRHRARRAAGAGRWHRPDAYALLLFFVGAARLVRRDIT